MNISSHKKNRFHELAIMSNIYYGSGRELPQHHRQRHFGRQSRAVDAIMLTQRALIGRGRDGLIFRLGRRNMEKTGEDGVALGEKWGGWVLKVPRFRLQELPQHYLKAVSQSITGEQKVNHARDAMVANFIFEGNLQSRLWDHLCQGYLKSAGFPSIVSSPYAWQPGHDTCANKVSIKMDFEEDKNKKFIDSTITRGECLMMPEGVMDAFQALLFHFTENLLMNFCRDILFQLQYLEERGVVHGDFKLSNVLLFVWDDGPYVFILADFWDAFSIDEEGGITEIQHPDEMREVKVKRQVMAKAPPEFRWILRWKFQAEKFGTRLYKDPHVLNELRKSKTKKPRFHLMKGMNAGKINIWSFGVVMGSFLCDTRDSEKIKKMIKEEILFSGRSAPKRRTLSEKEAVSDIRNLFSDLMVPSRDRPPKPGRAIHPNRLLGKSSLVDALAQTVMDRCMKLHNERGTTAQVLDDLKLNSRLPRSNERNIVTDLYNCQKCNSCANMKDRRDKIDDYVRRCNL